MPKAMSWGSSISTGASLRGRHGDFGSLVVGGALSNPAVELMYGHIRNESMHTQIANYAGLPPLSSVARVAQAPGL